MIDKFLSNFFGSIDKLFIKLNKTVDDLWTFNFPKPKKKVNKK